MKKKYTCTKAISIAITDIESVFIIYTFVYVTRVRNAFTHYKKEPLFEALHLFLLSVGLAVRPNLKPT